MIFYGKSFYSMVSMARYFVYWYLIVSFYKVVFYGIIFYSRVFYAMLFYSILFSGFDVMAWYFKVFYGIIFYGKLFYSVTFYGNLFYGKLFFSFQNSYVDDDSDCATGESRQSVVIQHLSIEPSQFNLVLQKRRKFNPKLSMNNESPVIGGSPTCHQ